MTRFESLTGFRENSAEKVRSKIRVDGTPMTSHANGRTMTCGTLGHAQPVARNLVARLHG